MTAISTLLPHSRTTAPAHPALGRFAVGGFFLVMGGVHLGLVSADPQVYEHFADHDDVALALEELADAAPHQLVVVEQEDLDDGGVGHVA